MYQAHVGPEETGDLGPLLAARLERRRNKRINPDPKGWCLLSRLSAAVAKQNSYLEGKLVVGFRTYPDGFSYVILEGSQQEPEIVAKDRLSYPKGASLGESFAWLRRQLKEIFETHDDIKGACIKTIEPMARKKSKERYQAEGVIFEAVYSLLNIRCESRINSQLKRDISDFNEPARYLTEVLAGSDQLKELVHLKFQVAALAAISEIPSDK